MPHIPCPRPIACPTSCCSVLPKLSPTGLGVGIPGYTDFAINACPPKEPEPPQPYTISEISLSTLMPLKLNKSYQVSAKYTSVILNYDEQSENLFKWYQQLIAESLGKQNKGLLPIISSMPKDNHSVMQLYLDGFKNNFFTFFYVNEKNSEKIKNNTILSSQYYLKNKNLSQVTLAQKKATENVFKNKNIPFRSFEINKRDEKTLGELFCFFILETILIGQSMNLNPYDQPAVELIKLETKKLLIKNT